MSMDSFIYEEIKIIKVLEYANNTVSKFMRH